MCFGAFIRYIRWSFSFARSLARISYCSICHMQCDHGMARGRERGGRGRRERDGANAIWKRQQRRVRGRLILWKESGWTFYSVVLVRCYGETLLAYQAMQLCCVWFFSLVLNVFDIIFCLFCAILFHKHGQWMRPNERMNERTTKQERTTTSNAHICCLCHGGDVLRLTFVPIKSPFNFILFYYYYYFVSFNRSFLKEPTNTYILLGMYKWQTHSHFCTLFFVVVVCVSFLPFSASRLSSSCVRLWIEEEINTEYTRYMCLLLPSIHSMLSFTSRNAKCHWNIVVLQCCGIYLYVVWWWPVVWPSCHYFSLNIHLIIFAAFAAATFWKLSTRWPSRKYVCNASVLLHFLLLLFFFINILCSTCCLRHTKSNSRQNYCT